MKSNLAVLRRRLRDFGLDPLDWCIEVQSILGSIEKIEISSVTDDRLRFEGWASKNNWLSISYYG